MYLMISRPDISFAVNYFSRFQDKGTEVMWKQLTRILRYLKGTKNYELIYKRDGNQGLEAYADADWGQDVVDRKSVTGYCIFWNNNLVQWCTKKQLCVALSSAEAELVSLCTCVCDGLWVKKLLLDLEMKDITFKVYEDNQACISLVQEPGKIKRVKHIDIKLKFMYQLIKEKKIFVEYIRSENQLADGLTKGLNRIKFKNFVFNMFEQF